MAKDLEATAKLVERCKRAVRLNGFVSASLTLELIARIRDLERQNLQLNKTDRRKRL